MKSVIIAVCAFLTVCTSYAVAQDSSALQQQQNRRDELRIAVQKICPVSGEKLGSHGGPIKAKIGEELVFLCCKGCIEGNVNPQHWVTIHANFAKAQRICPVMKQELPKTAKWTIVEGQIFYVCCPPCTDKIAADPTSFLHQLDELHVAYLKAKSQTR